MLIHWQSHQEYLNFLHETKIHPDSSQRTRLRLEFGPVREKLCLLDLDPVMEYLSAFYSPVGRPAKNQVQIIRSLILMAMPDFTSLTSSISNVYHYPPCFSVLFNPRYSKISNFSTIQAHIQTCFAIT